MLGERRYMPRKRRDDQSAYQFEMEAQLHTAGSEKARKYGFNLAALMRMHYEQFVDRPIEDSMRMLREYYESKQPTPKRASKRRK
jgi:hypothetical protein